MGLALCGISLYMTDSPQLILGFGYVAERLRAQIEAQEKTVLATSRTDSGLISFDLDEPETWDNLPQVEITYWMFPAAPLDLVTEFYKTCGSRLGKIVTVGSTSGFIVGTDGQKVDEATALDLSQDRVQGEEFLRSQGGVTVMSSGIYGPGRDPLNWIKKGYVGKSAKLVNMIHVEDLCQFLIKAAEIGENGRLYIASDNNPQTWETVIGDWERRGWAKEVPVKASDKISKWVNSSQSLSQLSVTLRYPNFVDRVL